MGDEGGWDEGVFEGAQVGRTMSVGVRLGIGRSVGERWVSCCAEGKKV